MRKLNVLLISLFALFFVASVHGQTGVNDAALNGNYAFTFTGVSGNGTTSSVFGAVGRFTADGARHLTSRELVTHGAGARATSPQPLTRTYSIRADNRGVINLNI